MPDDSSATINSPVVMVDEPLSSQFLLLTSHSKYASPDFAISPPYAERNLSNDRRSVEVEVVLFG